MAMAQETTEHFIRRMYERWNAEGISAMADDFFDADVEYEDDAVWPGGGAHIGRPAVVARFEEVITTLGLKEALVERVVDTGEAAAWVICTSGRSPGADVPSEHRWGYVGRIANGRLMRFRAYYSAEDALNAVSQAE
jgi:ketosteroid isomerase-like protein